MSGGGVTTIHLQETRSYAPRCFDLGGVATYDTRPMSEDWSKLRDIDPLADGHARVDFCIPLGQFPRIAPELARREGSATGSVRFAREAGVPVAEVSVEATLALACQRCFGALEWPVRARGRVALVAGSTEADRSPAELETILAPEHRISLRELVEEELLLALPLAALHPEAACGAAANAAATAQQPAAPSEDRQRPFAGLNELMKR